MKSPSILICIVFLLSCGNGQKQVKTSISPYTNLSVSDLLDKLSKASEEKDIELIVASIKSHHLKQPFTQESVVDQLIGIGKTLTNTLPEAAGLVFKLALTISKDLFPDQRDAPLLWDSYYRLGLATVALGDYQMALTYYDTLNKILTPAAGEIYFKNRLRMGQAYFELNEWSSALNHFMQTQKMLEKRGDKSLGWINSDVLTYVSNCYRSLKNLPQAILWAEKGVSLNLVSDPEESARAHFALANAWTDSLEHLDTENLNNSNPFLEAEKNIKAAKKIYESNLANYLSSFIVQSQNLGELYRRAKMPTKAKAELISTIRNPSFSNIDKHVFAPLYVNLGETTADLNADTLTLAYFDSAVWCLYPSYFPNRFAPLPSPQKFSSTTDLNTLLVIFNDIAKNCLVQFQKRPDQKHYLTRSIGAYDSILVLLNVTRSGYMTEDAKLKLANQTQDILRQTFTFFIDLYAQDKDQKYLEKAFRVSEYCKAFALLEAAKINNYKANVPNDLDKKERLLLRTLADTERQMNLIKNKNSADFVKAQGKYFDILNEMAVLKNELKTEAQSYWSLRYGGADLNIEAIQTQLLGKDQGLIEFFCSDTVTYVFLVTSNSFKLKSIRVPGDTLAKIISNFQLQLSKPYQPDTPDAFYQDKVILQNGYKLYNILLHPLAAELPDRLIVIPDDAINDLAFEALITQPGNASIQEVVNNEVFLLSTKAISYCFSANLLWEMKENQVPRFVRNCVSVFAATYNPELKVPSGINFQWARYLKPMGLNQETIIKNLKKNTKADIIPNYEVSKQKLIQVASETQYAHVIAHGFVDERDPNQSCVVFNQNGISIDTSNILLMNDFYGIKMPFELVGFSSCQTAQGPFLKGEGKKSMARSLAFSGARSFLATLWNIQMDGNAKTIPDFYTNMINKKIPKDRALAEAKRNLLSNEKTNIRSVHPSNWAGTILIGATDFQHHSNRFWPFLVAGLGLLLFLVWIFARRSKPKTSFLA